MSVNGWQLSRKSPLLLPLNDGLYHSVQCTCIAVVVEELVGALGLVAIVLVIIVTLSASPVLPHGKSFAVSKSVVVVEQTVNTLVLWTVSQHQTK
jgi:hypothetical protein